MNLSETSPGVFYSDDPLVAIGKREIDFVRQQAERNPKRRARICAHEGVDSSVHEMIICLLPHGYVQPHCHLHSESIHVIEGSCDVLLFDEHGTLESHVELGTGDGTSRYLRLAPKKFHTLIVRTDSFVFHETIQGPLNRDNTIYAGWAPSEQNVSEATEYLSNLSNLLADLRNQKKCDRDP